MGAQPHADRSRQGEVYRATVLNQMDRIFKGKTWDIERSIVLPEGQRFYTPFGRPCRIGYVLLCRETGERVPVGWKMLTLIHRLYLGVTLPVPLKPRTSVRYPIRKSAAT